jgi:site-specific DNA-methyltransferase (adenine-specific)
MELSRRDEQQLAPAEQLADYRRTMARSKAAAGIAREQARVLEKEDEVAREAISAAIDAEAECLGAEAAAGRWLTRLADVRERDLGLGGDRKSQSQPVTVKLADLGVTKSESSRWQQIGEIPDDVRSRYVEAVRRRQQRWISRQRLLRLWREEQAEQRRREPLRVSPPGAPDIRCGDFRVVLSDIPSGTVDAIITDPPYPREFLPLYGDLSSVAARLLVPSGVLAVMCGQSYLFEYLGLLARDLDYRWTAAYIAQGPRTRLHDARVGSGWKPILLFQRKDATDIAFLLDDLFSSHADDKRFHHWGQSESGMAAIVERLSTPGALVVDPFVGGGTTAVVCRDLERRFIGCDIDAAAVSVAQERLGAC